MAGIASRPGRTGGAAWRLRPAARYRGSSSSGVNAWMQLPVGFHLQNGRVMVSDPIAIFKQPGWFYMALHSTLSCYIAVGFAVAAVYAWGVLRKRTDAYHRSALLVAMAVGGISAVLQPFSGDLLAKFVFRTQPAKFAAMEGQFKTERYAPLRIGGWPDLQQQETLYAIRIPGGLSFLAAHDPSTEVRGLDQIPRGDWPNVHLTHSAFQVMVGIGTALVALAGWFWIAWWRRRERTMAIRPLMWAIVVAGPLGFIALEAGWVVTEVGRQPWVINGILRTRDAVTPSTAVPPIFYGFVVLYAVLAITVIVLLRRLARPEQSGGVLAPQEVPAR
ncbi:MAG TPA: cytochrome ubiquinol oxidase subunit I [Tepidisphaeraceae bacterium]|nr:cytochrome ubiquinol oxidase subunit I [Tepidisphaeraceae bacterium]